MAISNIEITDVSRYSEWLRNKWGKVAGPPIANSAVAVLKKEDLSADDHDFIRARTQDDQRLYARIMDRLAANGTLSINGLDLAIAR